MKFASSLAAFSLLLTMLLSGPASARGKLTVINQTQYTAKVSIVYYTHLCKDDHPTLAPRARWSVNTGLCEVKDSVVVLTDKKGVGHTCQGTRGHTLQAVFRIQTMNDPSEFEGKGITVTTTGPFCGIASA
jgi:hypothetical protein